MDGLRLVFVPGTDGHPYLFGGCDQGVPVDIPDFHIGATPVTQALWMRVMGSTRTRNPQPQHPVTDVSWEDVTGPNGFLQRLNASDSDGARGHFRLPTETEWEYAARGGPHWRDDYRFSGSNDADAVAWYGSRWSNTRSLGMRLLGRRLGWRIFGRQLRGSTSTHPVGNKRSNQLGIYDMSGNVWEWCQDLCTDEFAAVPRDGTAYLGAGDDRRLRGGCHHNWDLHCTVSWRYGIAPDFHDGCVGFRLAR